MNTHHKRYALIAAAACILASADAAEAADIPVTQFGARPNDGKDDTAGLQAAIEAAKKRPQPRLVFAPGRYDFFEQRGGGNAQTTCGVNEIRGVTIDGKGAEFIYHGLTTPFAFGNCRSVTLRNITIDWERPPFSLGKVIAAEARHFDVEVFPEYPIAGGEAVPAFMDYDPTTKLPRRQGFDAYNAVTGTELLRPHVLSVKLVSDMRLQTGSWVLLRHQTYSRPAIFFRRCTDVKVSNVTIRTCPGMGLVGEQCTNVSLDRVTVAPAPGSSRPMSSTADATHFKGCRGLIRMTDCVFEGMGDDATNVGGLYLTVQERLDDRTVLAAHNLKIPSRPDPGDRIEFVRRDTLLPYATATVKAASEAVKDGVHRIEFSAPLPADLKIGDVLGNISHTPKVRISRCRVANNRARGFLLQTYDAVVENCEFRNCTSGGVWCLNEVVFFFECVGARNIVIRNNTFENCNYGGPLGEGVISVYSYLADFKFPPKPGVHRDITIEGNTIRGSDNCGIFVTGTDGLKIRNNTIEQACRKPTRDEWRSAVYIMSTRNAEIAGNRIDPKAQGEGFRKPITLGDGCEQSTIRIANP
jgi:parallel beta-helix repeat protein